MTTVAERETTVVARSCPQCGEACEPADAHCASCGAALHEGRARAVSADEVEEGYHCETCGSRVRGGGRSRRCAFCGSTYVVELPPDEDHPTPHVVALFQVEQDEATRAVRGWLSRRWLAPGAFRRQERLEGVQCVYVPFWAFSTRAESRWRARIGEFWYEQKKERYRAADGKWRTRTRTVRHTEWHGLSGKHHEFLANYLVSGSNGLPQRDADRLKPFDLTGGSRYAPHVVAGWSVEDCSVERDAAWDRSKAAFFDAETDAVARFLPGDVSELLEIETSFHDIAGSLVLLPVWLLTVRHEDTPYRVLVNGQSGRVTGESPTSPWKITGIALIVVAIIVTLLIVYGG